MHFGERGSKAFGALLRFHRERAGLTMEALGKHVGYSKSQVAMVERGERPPKGRLVELAEERKTHALHVYQNHLVPGSLQTEAYARAVYLSECCPTLEDSEIDQRLAERLARQELFTRKPQPTVSYVLEESTLTRPLGGRDALREQLHHLLAVGRMRNIDIQVMPHDREIHAGLNGPMILLETAKRAHLAYVEGPSGGYFISEQPDLGDLFGRYGILRAQALTPEESATLIEKVAREV
ncbi:helix-turn-helix domain-containing protein [Streptomyces endophyticus]|uniref:Helix-turn-helix transcriptional regulator n=1 Tax=Streptomyces endophyticus TaxID=714166 RepID=A0ABU6FGK7_9ACTN|nr:helix-turn-helix transcriptional regulator [Streptomyces endophyticus]MEB8342613.1 helix-turn-helix transcriptional regulator [Streptomyces endophyticus]